LQKIFLELDVKAEKETIKQVRNTITKYNMIRRGDLIVVAVSGGPDSVCLLNVLYELKDKLGIELVVAHFNHGLRPGEDETETRFVESLALSCFYEEVVLQD
jgi:tRNA(Ile)-lysidine synthase